MFDMFDCTFNVMSIFDVGEDRVVLLQLGVVMLVILILLFLLFLLVLYVLHVVAREQVGDVVSGFGINGACILGVGNGKFLIIFGILVGLSFMSVNLPCTAIDLPNNLVVGLELDDKGSNLRNMIGKHLFESSCSFQT